VGATRGKHGEGRGIYKVLGRRSEYKRPPGRLRRRWKNKIKLDLSERGIVGETWI